MVFTYQINKEVKWNYNEELLKKARKNIPNLSKQSIDIKSVVEPIKDNHSFGGISTQKTHMDINRLEDYVFNKDEKLILDLGEHYVGRFSIDINSVGSPMDAPLYIKLKFAEVPAELAAKTEDYKGWLSKSWIQEEFIHLDELPGKLSLPRRYSCRYIEIQIIDTSPKWGVSFSNPKFIAESSVQTEGIETLKTEDKKLKQIYNTSVKTLQNCMQYVFEDGPKRDRRLWIGDLRLQALANYYTFNDTKLVKNGLYLFAGMTANGGKIAANVFTSPQLMPDDTFLFDYSMFFAVILYDYINYSNDQKVLDDLYETAKSSIDLGLKQVNDEGALYLNEEWPAFIDWSNAFDKSTAAQAALIYSLKRFIILAKKVNESNLIKYEQILEKLENFSRNQLYDSKSNQFIVENSGEINIASQVWMVLAGVMDRKTNKKILEKTIQTQFPVTGIATPYLYHHIVEALFIAGLREDAIDLLRNYWGKMIDLGADTFWEAFMPENLNYSPYGSPIISSYCHAWSCTPPYLIKKYLLNNPNDTGYLE